MNIIVKNKSTWMLINYAVNHGSLWILASIAEGQRK